MPVNPAVRAAASQELAVAGGPGRKSEPTAADPAFAALLAMLVAAPVPAIISGAEPATGAEPGEGEAASPQVVAPAQSVETVLQAQRVATLVEAAAADFDLPADIPPVAVPDGTWVIEPVPPAQAPLVQEPAAKVPVVQESVIQEFPAQATPVRLVAEPPPVPRAVQAASPTVHEIQSTPSVTPVPGLVRAQVPKEQDDQPADPMDNLRTGFVEPRQVGFTPAAESKPAATATPARLPTPVDPDRLMAALARSLSHADDGSYSVTVRLHPEHLGEVRLSLQLQGREVQTVMEVGSASARQALESRGEQLRQGLDQAGLTLSGFQVSTGQQHRSPGDPTRFDPEETASPRAARRAGTGSGPAPAPSLRSLTASPTRRGGLDTLA